MRVSLPIAHCKPRVERRCAGNVDPAMASECLHGTFNGHHSASDGLERDACGDVCLIPDPLDFVVYLEELTQVYVCVWM